VSTASVKCDLLESLKDKEFREAFILESVYASLCFQLRALREQREMSQASLGRKVTPPMAQERISILEDPNAETKPTLNTLLRIANALDIGLDVRFISLAKVLDLAVHTDMNELRVNSCADDMNSVGKQIDFELALEKSRARALRSAQLGTIQSPAASLVAISNAEQKRGLGNDESNTKWVLGSAKAVADGANSALSA